MRKLWKASLLLLVVSALAGCGMTGVSLADIGVVKAVACDKSENANYRLTFCMMKTDGLINLSSEGDTLSEALGSLSDASERAPYMSQNDVLVLSEAVASEDVRPMIQAFYTMDDSFKKEYLMILEGQASEALEAEGFVEDAPGGIPALLKNAAEHSFVINTTVRQAEQALNGIGKTELIPIGRMDGGALHLVDMGVIRDGKLVGRLSRQASLGAKLLRGEPGGFRQTLELKGEKLGVEYRNFSTSVQSRKAGEKIVLDVQVDFHCVVSEQSGRMDLTQEENGMAVLAVARENAKQLCEQSIWEAAALEADFLNFGAAYLNRYPDEIPRYADTWGEELKKIQVNLEIKGDIRYLNPEKKDYIWE